MKSEITFHKVNGVTVPKLRGGRGTRIMNPKKQYSRKDKSWKREVYK